jgi:hypothetical protein
VYEPATAFDFTASDASPITHTCSVDGGPFAPCTAAGRHELTGLSLGIHAITVRVVDAAGNATEAGRRFVVATREATGSGGTTVSEGEAPPVAPFKPTIRSRFSARRAWTTFSVLQLRDLPSDARVVFACKGGGCPVKRRMLSHKGGTLDVRKLVGRRLRLRAGAVLELRVTSAQGDVKVARWAMRRGKLPKDSYRCAARGQRLGACS